MHIFTSFAAQNPSCAYQTSYSSACFNRPTTQSTVPNVTALALTRHRLPPYQFIPTIIDDFACSITCFTSYDDRIFCPICTADYRSCSITRHHLPHHGAALAIWTSSHRTTVVFLPIMAFLCVLSRMSAWRPSMGIRPLLVHFFFSILHPYHPPHRSHIR
jgi:hypothetical protein